MKIQVIAVMLAIIGSPAAAQVTSASSTPYVLPHVRISAVEPRSVTVKIAATHTLNIAVADDLKVPGVGALCGMVVNNDLTSHPDPSVILEGFDCLYPDLVTYHHTYTLSAVRIVAYGEAPPGSGYLHTWRKIVVLDNNSIENDVYTTWLGKGQTMPPINAVCDIVWHWDDTNGWSKPYDGGQMQADIAMDSFTCPRIRP